MDRLHPLATVLVLLAVLLCPPVVGAGPQPEHEALYWEYHGLWEGAQAVRMGHWKGIRKPFASGPLQLFDLRNDLGEQRNIAQQHPQVVARMAAAMKDAHVPSPLWKVRVRKPAGKKKSSGPRKK